MTTNTTEQQYTALYPKRKFSLSLGIKRTFDSYSEFFGLESLSDHLFFTGTIVAILAVCFICLISKLQMGVL